MKTIIITAWRNVWRNRMRSLVIIIAVAIGLMGGLFGSGIMKGWINQRINDAIYNETSHIQIHHPKFSENNEFKYSIGQANELYKYLDSLQEVKAYSGRVRFNAMAQTNQSGGHPIEIVAVTPSMEKGVSDINELIVDSTGEFVQDNDYRRIFVGEKLCESIKIINYKITEDVVAQLEEDGVDNYVLDTLNNMLGERFTSKIKLEVTLKKKLGEKDGAKYLTPVSVRSKYYRTRARVSVTSTDPQGNIIGNRFRIEGIYSTSNSSFDQKNVLMSKKAANSFMGTDTLPIHEVAVLLNDTKNSKEVSSMIKERFPDLEVKTWKDIDPAVGMQSEYLSVMNYYIMFFILFALAFGIVNTMLMAILERTKEIGMLMAIGMNKLRLFSMVMMETIFLTGTGAVTGIILGGVILEIFNKRGIDLTMFEEGFEAMGYSSVIYPESDLSFFVGTILLVVFVSILASIYPARKAIKMNPADAIRTE
jgi:ABC-type lipoprotein release transport system permease subunit